MKEKKFKILDSYSLLDKAKYSKMESLDRKTIVMAMYPIKKVVDDFNAYKDDVVKRLTPENYRDIVEILNEVNAMSEKSRMSVLLKPRYASAIKANMEFNNSINQCLIEELNKEVEIEFEPLSEESFDRLCESNQDWTLGQSMNLHDILCRKEG